MFTSLARQDEHVHGVAAAVLELLCEHLAAASAHCVAIQAAQISLGSTLKTGANGRDILRQNKSLAVFVGDLRARELAIALRLIQATVVADRAAGLMRTYAPIAQLVKAGAAVLVEAGSRIASEQLDEGAFGFLVSRGLIEAGCIDLPNHITGGDHIVVLGVMPLADVRAFLDAARLAIEARLMG